MATAAASASNNNNNGRGLRRNRHVLSPGMFLILLYYTNVFLGCQKGNNDPNNNNKNHNDQG